MEHKVPADHSIRELYTHHYRPQEEEEQEATPWLGGQRRIARMVFPECLTKALGSSRDAEIIHPRAQAVQVCELLLTQLRRMQFMRLFTNTSTLF